GRQRDTPREHVAELVSGNPRCRRTRPGVFATVTAMAHTYGYARVSTTAQNLTAQVDALTGTGGVDVRDVVVERASGRREDRPELARVLAQLREGDTLVVTKLDRLGRSAAHVARLVRDLDERGVTLRSLSETLDSSS